MGKRRFPNFVWAGAVCALGIALGSCTPGGQFDPTEVFSNKIFDTKKPLPGDREPLFPNGVPGAETGVPPDLVKGYQPPAEQAATSPEAAPKPVACGRGEAQTKAKSEAETQARSREGFAGRCRKSLAAANSAWPAPPQPAAQTNWPAPPGVHPSFRAGTNQLAAPAWLHPSFGAGANQLAAAPGRANPAGRTVRTNGLAKSARRRPHLPTDGFVIKKRA